METVLALLGFAGLVGLVMLWGKAKQAMITKATQTVMRGSHSRGQNAVRTTLTFRSSRVAAPAMLENIRATVNAYDSAPVLPGLFLAARDARQLVFAFGGKAGTALQTRVTVVPDGDGCRGSFEVLEWRETNGIVDRVDQVDRVRERVIAGVRAADAESTVDTSAATASPA